MPELQPGQLLDRFRVVRSIATGGMADVFLVRHASLGTVHALKQLVYRSTDVDARFLREGRIQAQLQHPHIVPVRDVLETEFGPCLVLDYVAGPDLHDLIVDNALTWPELRGLMHGLLRGLGFAHSRGVIHRDLKPQNVLLDPVPGGVRPRLVDFGLAKVRVGPHAGGGTGTGITMGTPAFMSPEQMRDAKRVTTRSDLFSLAAVFYIMATRRAPWSGGSLIEVLKARRAGPPLSLHVSRPDIPPEVADLILDLLKLDPDDRPQNVEEVAGRMGLPLEPITEAVAAVGGPTLGRITAV